MRKEYRGALLKFIVLIALLASFSAAVRRAAADCNEWTICSPQGASASSSAPPPAAGGPGRDSWGLPHCTPDDERGCKNRCHGSFGDDYWRCVNSCLSGSCSQYSGTGTGNWAAADDQRGCVELRSDECSKQCADRTGSELSRCRRDCLEKACPEASKLDIAKEGANPGSLACSGCAEKYKLECSQSCGGGVIGPGGAIGVAGSVICERSCLSVHCGARCGVGLD